MKKRILSFLLAGTMALGLFSVPAFAADSADGNDAVQVWTMNSLSRVSVINDEPMPVPQNASSNAELYALKGETTSFQAVVTALDGEVTVNHVTVSDLAGPGGTEIKSSGVDIYREHFVHIPGGVIEGEEWKEDENGNEYVEYIGDGRHSNLAWDGLDYDTAENRPETLEDVWYPDALIPLEQNAAAAKYKALPEVAEQGDNMPFWFDINVPADAEAGYYTGTYTVETDKGNVTGAITLKVWNYVMPAESSLYTSMSIKPAGSYSDYDHDYINNINAINELLQNRFNVSDPLKPEQYVQIVSNGQRYVELGFWGNASWGDVDMDPAPSNAAVAARVAELKAALGEDIMMVSYVVDEIEYAYDGIQADWDDTDPDAMAAAHDNFRQKLFDWHKVLNDNGVKLLAVTKPYRDMLDDTDLGGNGDPIVDIFVVLDTLYEQEYPAYDEGDICADIAALAVEKGCDIWTYSALIQDTYSPSWQLDYSPINFRIAQGFINQAIGATGFLNWTCNAWSDEPWENPWIPAFPNVVGEGLLVYPGTEAGVDGFVPSIRLKYVRDGVYDYDYVELLKKAGYADEAGTIVSGVAEDFKTWTKDAQVLLEARISLGELLNEIGDAENPGSPEYTVAIGEAARGGAGFTRSVTVTVPNGESVEGKYIVAQLTQGTGTDAKVSVVMYKLDGRTSTISYNKAGTVIDVWLASGMPDLMAEDMGGCSIPIRQRDNWSCSIYLIRYGANRNGIYQNRIN